VENAAVKTVRKKSEKVMVAHCTYVYKHYSCTAS
jgi:hypothetical protein